jgi:hypothetical protein
MATIRNGLVTSFNEELGEGIHVLSTDTLKIALFDDNATLTEETTAYSVTNEVSGTGYSAGGATLVLSSGYPLTNSLNQREYRFETVTWSNASLTARAALIYNSSKSNRAIRVIDFGQNRTSHLFDFELRFPVTLPPLIRIASG